MGKQRVTRGELLVGALNVGGGTTVKKFKTGQVAVDPGPIASVSRGSVAVTITGLAVGDIVYFQPPAALNDDLVYHGCRVTGADTVTIYLYNPTGAAIDDTSRTWDYLWFDFA